MVKGIVKVPLNPEQPAKALIPIVVTDEGIIKLPLNPVQPSKALKPIVINKITD